MKYSFHVRFDNFEFESGVGVFHESGTKIHLKPKELAVLDLLLRQQGKLVTKDQLVSIVWGGSSVSDESIARSISVLKSRLREASPSAESLIKNVYGRGYLFTGSITFFGHDTTKNIGKQKKISDIASKDILSCNPNTTLLQAANLLHQQRKSSIIITENDHYLGIWTEADAMVLNLTDPAVFETKISEVMHFPVITVQEWRPLSDAVILMRKRNIRHLLVVDKQEKACGVITQTDLVRSHGVASFLSLKNVKSVVYRDS